MALNEVADVIGHGAVLGVVLCILMACGACVCWCAGWVLTRLGELLMFIGAAPVVLLNETDHMHKSLPMPRPTRSRFVQNQTLVQTYVFVS